MILIFFIILGDKRNGCMCLLQPPVPASSVTSALNAITTPSPSQRSDGSNGPSNQQSQQQSSGAGTPTNRRQKSWDLLDQTAIAQARQQKQHSQQTQHQVSELCVLYFNTLCLLSYDSVVFFFH